MQSKARQELNDNYTPNRLQQLLNILTAYGWKEVLRNITDFLNYLLEAISQ